jgi:hypothetical protein
MYVCERDRDTVCVCVCVRKLSGMKAICGEGRFWGPTHERYYPTVLFFFHPQLSLSLKARRLESQSPVFAALGLHGAGQREQEETTNSNPFTHLPHGSFVPFIEHLLFAGQPSGFWGPPPPRRSTQQTKAQHTQPSSPLSTFQCVNTDD